MYGSRLEVKRFEDRIVKHEAYPVEEGMILFYGHSLFTRCSNITNFKENPNIEESVRMKDGSKAIINHAFGTSSADDLLAASEEQQQKQQQTRPGYRIP